MMRQILTLKRGLDQIIQTRSPKKLIDKESGNYSVDFQLHTLLSDIWPMDDYTGELTLEVVNG
jgi:hypothetical protein